MQSKNGTVNIAVFKSAPPSVPLTGISIAPFKVIPRKDITKLVLIELYNQIATFSKRVNPTPNTNTLRIALTIKQELVSKREEEIDALKEQLEIERGKAFLKAKREFAQSRV